MICLFKGFIIFCFLFVAVCFFAAGVFKKVVLSNLSWSGPYECGFCSNSLSFKFFGLSYFSLLVFFVVFDLEISLLLKMPEQKLLFKNFYFYYLFIWILVVGYLSEVMLGYVRWGY